MDPLPLFSELTPVDGPAPASSPASTQPSQQANLPLFDNSSQPPLPNINDLIPSPSAQAPQPSQDQPLPDFKDLTPKPEQGGLIDQITQGGLAALQGAASTMSLGTVVGPEMAAGVSPETIKGLQANPDYGAGQVGGAVGLGLLAIDAVAASPLVAAAGLTAAGSMALINFGIGAGQGIANVTSDYYLGESDPEHPVSAAISQIGMAGLTQMVTGMGMDVALSTGSSALKAIANTRVGNATAKFLAEFGAGTAQRVAAPDKTMAVTNELKNFVGVINDFMGSVRGSMGLKSQLVSSLSKDVAPEALASHITGVSNILEDAHPDMQSAIDAWKAKIAPVANPDTMQFPNIPSPQMAANVFKATETLKQEFQSAAGYNMSERDWGELSPSERSVFQSIRKTSGQLVDTLEDQNVWGKLGDVQAKANALWSQFLDPLKNFSQSFMQDDTVTGDKIATYMNGFKKPTAEFKPSRMRNFVESGESLLSGMSDLYAQNGVSGEVTPVSLNNVKSTYNVQTGGQKLADAIYNPQVSKLAVQMAGTAALGIAGNAIEGPIAGSIAAAMGPLTPELSEAIGIPIRDKVMPWVARTLTKNFPMSCGPAMEYGNNVISGNRLMDSGVEHLFGGAAINTMVKDKEKEKIKKYLDAGGADQQIQNTLQQQNQMMQQGQSTRGFAEGGEVKPAEPLQSPAISSTPSSLGSVLPAQNTMLAAAHGRVYNYLNSIRPADPKTQSRAPFDDPMEDPEAARKYDRALTIAAKPMSIIPEIKNGTLTPEHVQHMQQMWPEVHSQLSKKMTERISKAQLNDEIPDYHTRQSMSMFLGAPLDSTFTPANIQAAQSVFINQAQQKTQAAAIGKPKRGTSTLGKAQNQYKTPGQAAEADQATRPT